MSLCAGQPDVTVLFKASRHFALSLPVSKRFVDYVPNKHSVKEWTGSGLSEKRNSSGSKTNKVNVLEDQQCL